MVDVASVRLSGEEALECSEILQTSDCQSYRAEIFIRFIFFISFELMIVGELMVPECSQIVVRRLEGESVIEGSPDSLPRIRGTVLSPL